MFKEKSKKQPLKSEPCSSSALNNADFFAAIEFLSSDQADQVVIGPERQTVTLKSLGGSWVTVTIKAALIQPEDTFQYSPAQPTFESKPEWTTEELEAGHLPLEWSRTWLIEQLYHQPDVGLLSQLTLKPVEILREFIQQHNIEHPQKEYAQLLWDSGKFRTQADLAQHLGVRHQWVSSHLGKSRYTENNDRAKQILADVEAEFPALSIKAKNTLIIDRLIEAGDKRNRKKLSTTLARIRKEPRA